MQKWAIDLTNDEYKVLSKLINDSDMGAVQLLNLNGNCQLIIHDESKFEELFDRITNLLLSHGVDDNYEVNSAGRILEGLIDKIGDTSPE